jgi:hypothetical protein
MAASKDRDADRKPPPGKGRNTLLAAMTPSLPSDERTEKQHSRTADKRVAAAKAKGGKR